jgi:hypothetical protein
MILHNHIREYSSGDVDFANCDRDLDFVLTIPDRYNKYAMLPHTSYDSTFEASFFMMDEFCDSVAKSLFGCVALNKIFMYLF